jgi:HEXXH motif-containing protein
LKPMRLDEGRWAVGGGRTPEWAWVHERRRADARRSLAAIERTLRTTAPSSARARRFGPALSYLRRSPDRAIDHPAFDYWLFLWDSHFSRPAEPEDWDLQLGLAGHFAAGSALARRVPLSCGAALDPDGRLYLYGTPWHLEFPGKGRAKVALEAKAGKLKVKGDGIDALFSLDEPKGAAKLLEAAPGIVVDDRGWLQVHGVTMHGLARLEDAERARFAEVIGRALSDMRERDPELHAEMTDLLTVLVPLQNPMNHGSVSSSYVNLRGLIALSHSEDPLLQAETLIHEFCHMKMNQLLAADPVILPGQSGQVYYSPWRKDARRLRGLLLGAHAFLNVARYLARSLEREERSEAEEIEVMVNVARRVLQVEDALRGVTEHAELTEFGRRFVHRMWRELGVVRHATLWYPAALLAEQKAECAAHRAAHALNDTALHRDAALVDKIARPAFLAPKPEAA